MVGWNIKVPVLGNPGLFILLRQIEQQAMAREQFENTVDHRLQRRDITQGKEFRESAAVETRLETREFEQSLDFRGEGKAVSNHPVVERLYAQAITRAEQPFGARVPDCKCEHATQMVNA